MSCGASLSYLLLRMETKNFQWIVKVFKFSEACDTNSYQIFSFLEFIYDFLFLNLPSLWTVLFSFVCAFWPLFIVHILNFSFHYYQYFTRKLGCVLGGGVNWDRSLLLVLEENIGIWFIHTLYLIQLRHMYIFQSTIYFKNTFYFEVWLQFNKSCTCASPRFHHAKHKKTQTK